MEKPRGSGHVLNPGVYLAAGLLPHPSLFTLFPKLPPAQWHSSSLLSQSYVQICTLGNSNPRVKLPKLSLNPFFFSPTRAKSQFSGQQRGSHTHLLMTVITTPCSSSVCTQGYLVGDTGMNKDAVTPQPSFSVGR